MVSAHAEENYQTYLSQGHQFFNDKAYSQALAAYQNSYNIEPLDSTLYNIAVTHFKLQQWQQALENFEELKVYQGHSDIVEYNIGVAHKKLGNTQQALSVFEELLLIAESDKFVDLANRQIAQLNGNASIENTQVEDDSASLWQTMLSLQYGNDNNITLPDDDTNQEQSDQYLDLMVNTSWMSDSNLANAWMVDFTYFKSSYSEASDYDVSLYAISGRKYFTPESHDKYRFWLGLGYDSIALSGEDYISNVTFSLGAQYQLSADQRLTLDISQKSVSEGEARFNYLAGSSSRIRLTWRNRVENGYWRAGIRYQIDDRDDRIDMDVDEQNTVFEGFTSFSASRLTFFASRTWYVNDWEFNVDAQYRYSEFDDANIGINYTTNGVPTSTSSLGVREDDRYGLILGAVYNINDDLSINVEYDVSSNSSTIASFDYTQSSIAAGVTWMF